MHNRISLCITISLPSRLRRTERPAFPPAHVTRCERAIEETSAVCPRRSPASFMAAGLRGGTATQGSVDPSVRRKPLRGGLGEADHALSPIRYYIVAVLFVFVHAPAQADVVTLTFEGVGNLDCIGSFYNSPLGGEFGITFPQDAFGAVDRDAGGCCFFANEPSPSTRLFFRNPRLNGLCIRGLRGCGRRISKPG